MVRCSHSNLSFRISNPCTSACTLFKITVFSRSGDNAGCQPNSRLQHSSSKGKIVCLILYHVEVDSKKKCVELAWQNSKSSRTLKERIRKAGVDSDKRIRQYFEKG